MAYNRDLRGDLGGEYGAPLLSISRAEPTTQFPHALLYSKQSEAGQTSRRPAKANAIVCNRQVHKAIAIL
jgi:hypothetical protein